jgi:hypothetical protein
MTALMIVCCRFAIMTLLSVDVDSVESVDELAKTAGENCLMIARDGVAEICVDDHALFARFCVFWPSESSKNCMFFLAC